MNQFEARKAIAQAWIAQWPTLSGSVPFAIDKDPKFEVVPYARVEINFDDDNEQHTMGNPGNRKFLRRGLIVVSFWTAPGSGMGQIDQFTEYARTMFEEVRLAATGTEEGVRTFAANPGRAVDDGEYAMASVGIDFEYFQVR